MRKAQLTASALMEQHPGWVPTTQQAAHTRDRTPPTTPFAACGISLGALAVVRQLPLTLPQHPNRYLRTLEADAAQLSLIRLVCGFHHEAGQRVVAAAE